MKIIAVTVCRNEEKYIRKCILSVMNQTLPVFYVVVDDDSTDNTPKILDECKIPHITLKHVKSSLGGVRLATGLVRGVKFAEKHVPDWDYLLKVDADVVLPKDYVESMIREMEKDPKIGIASGCPIVKTRSGYKPMKMDKQHASDAARIYRSECWKSFKVYGTIGYDSYLLFKARQMGWETTHFDIPYYEERPWGKRTIKWWIGRGEARFVLGYPFRYQILFFISKIMERPFFVGSLAMVMSYMLRHLTPWHRVFPEDYYQFVKNFILKMAAEKIHVQLEKVFRGSKLKN